MFFKKKNEFGRTMIEMLGVLGVVGLLSVAAIQGYRFINLSLEISQIEDTLYKGLSLVNGKQITTLADLENFFKKARLAKGRNFSVEKVTCPDENEGSSNGRKCYGVRFSQLNKNIVEHFLNNPGPFTAIPNGATGLLLKFEIKRRGDLR